MGTGQTIQDELTAFALVVEARKLITGVNSNVQGAKELDWSLLKSEPGTKLGRPKTSAERYLYGYLRMKWQNLDPLGIAYTKNSFYFYRAAYIFVNTRNIRLALSKADKIAKTEGRGQAYYAQINRLVNYVDRLKHYRPDPEHQRRPSARSIVDKHAADPSLGKWINDKRKRIALQKLCLDDTGPKQPLRQTSKKKGLSTLPDDWREQYWHKVKDSSYADAIAVLYCTGCRPGELEKGVMVSLDEGGNLRFVIEGIKTHGGKYGQQHRILTEAINSPAARHLVDLLRDGINKQLVITSDAKKLSDTMRWHSKALWPKRKYIVSPYSFRHQKSADAKTELPANEVAMVMGHCNDETQSYYGGTRLAKGSNTVLKVEASREPRKTKRHNQGPPPWMIADQSHLTGPDLGVG